MNPAHHYVQVVQDDQLFIHIFGAFRAGLESLGEIHSEELACFSCMEIVILRIFVMSMPQWICRMKAANGLKTGRHCSLEDMLC